MTGHAGQVRAVVTGTGSFEIKWPSNPPTTSRRTRGVLHAPPSQHGRVRTPFFPGTGGVPPLFREREPPSVPTSAKRGFAKNFRVPGKKGERPESGFGSGNDQTPYAPEMPVPPSRSHFRSGFTSTPVLFPLLVPTSVPGFARCCLFRVPFPQRENPEVESTPRGGAGKKGGGGLGWPCGFECGRASQSTRPGGMQSGGHAIP